MSDIPNSNLPMDSASDSEATDRAVISAMDTAPSEATNKASSTLLAGPSTSKMTGTATRSKKTQESLQGMLDRVTPFFDESVSQKTVHQKISLQDFSKTSASLLMSHYKVEDEDVLNTTALAMTDVLSNSKKTSFRNRFGRIRSSLESLEPYQQLFKEKDSMKLLSQRSTKRLMGHLEKLDMTANAALQTLILVSAMNLTGVKPSGLKMDLKLPSSNSSGLSKTEVKKRLRLLTTISEILYQRMKSLQDAGHFHRIHKDFIKIVTGF